MDEEQATAETVLDGVAPGSGAMSSATDASSMADALRLEEVERWRGLLRLGRGIGAAMVLPLPLLGGDTRLKILFAATLVIGVIWGVILDRILRDPRRYTHLKVLAMSLWIIVAAYSGVFYWGVFSAAPTFIVLGIYFLANGESRASAIIVYAVNAGMQALLATLVISGVVPDLGIFVRPEVPMRELMVEQALVQVAYLSAFYMAMSARRAKIESIESLQQATRAIAQREAMLQEARNDLDRALQVGGPGRFTDRTFGAFKAGHVIGRGAMGEVYEATHKESGERGAIKLLHAHVLGDPKHVSRFLREARAMSALRSPHVVRVLEASDPMEPVPYLTMERLEGEDLAAILRARPRLPPADVVDMVRQVGRVLDAARGEGIVHRDIKPHNLFLTRPTAGTPVWKVLDFGVSMLGDTTGTLTHGHVVGTPSYMAPEQARGDAVDYRADLYSLAAVTYRCLTGHPPFSGKDVASLLYRVVHNAPRRPSSLADLPPDADVVVLAGMARDPANRYDSAATFADALEQAFESEARHDPARALL